ncbi:Peptidase C45-like protein [Abortiporus biennis]
MSDKPKIKLSGTSYEIGFEHGRLLASQILDQLEIYRDIFQQSCKFDWTEVRKIASEYEATIAKLVPHIFEEIKGIADGVNAATQTSHGNGSQNGNANGESGHGSIDVLDIVALNSRSEIALGKWDDGCTSLAWRIEGAGNSKKQFLAQNWDWRASVGKNLAMASIYQEGKPDIIMVIEPGIVGKIGFNSASVGVCLNAIRARPISTSLLPIHIILRLCLEATSIKSAIETIERFGGSGSSQHILIADASSEFGSRGLELSPLGSVYLKPDSEGILVHSNHFLENKFVEEPPWLSGSPIRLERIRKLSEHLVEEVGSNGINPTILRQRIFSDEHNSPQAICCSPDLNKDYANDRI